MTAVAMASSSSEPELPGEGDRRTLPSRITLTEPVERVWSLLGSHHGHLLVVGASGHGKTSTLRLLMALGTEAGTRTLTDPGARLARGDLLLVDDAHTRAPGDVRDLCSKATSAGARVVLATLPDRSWQREVVEGAPNAFATTSLEAWGADDVLDVAGPDALTPPGVQALLERTGGLPWLVAATLRGTVERRVHQRLRELVDEDADHLSALACGLPPTRKPRPLGVADTGAEVDDPVDRLIAAGLLTIDGRMPPDIRRLVLRQAPQHRIAALVRARLDSTHGQDDSDPDQPAPAAWRAGPRGRGDDLVELAEDLVAAGVSDPRLGTAIEQAADADIATSPRTSASRYGTAIEAGGDVVRLGVKRVEALALAGDVGDAMALLERMAPTPTSPYLRVATTVSLLAWQPERAAALWRWAMAGPADGLSVVARAVGAYALLGVGEADAAQDLLRRGAPEAPSTEAALATKLAEAVFTSLSGDGRAALPALVEVATVTTGRHRSIVLPDHPAALAATICLGWGDVPMAESVLTPALADPTTSAVDRSRLSALMAWVAMTTGRFTEAEQHLDAIDPAVRRDEPWLRAVRIGLARRRDDLGELTRLWAASRGELLGHPEDLYSLLPLGELGLAGARLRDHDVVDAAWARAADLLRRAGDPPAWSATFHWYGVQAAILSERPQDLAPHATSLVRAARTSTYAARLADAARAWVRALGGESDVAEADAAARALGQVGQAWEGARLAAHAAVRATSKRDSAVLMECARDLRGELASDDTAHAAAPPVVHAHAGGIELSPREREVVELVLAGLTYREIGSRLFLSAKTVEHHMARIKRRSDAESRGELLRQLAATLHPAAPPDRPDADPPA